MVSPFRCGEGGDGAGRALVLQGTGLHEQHATAGRGGGLGGDVQRGQAARSDPRLVCFQDRGVRAERDRPGTGHDRAGTDRGDRVDLRRGSLPGLVADDRLP